MTAPSVFTKLCEVFEIETLTENQKKAIKAVIEGDDVLFEHELGVENL